MMTWEEFQARLNDPAFQAEFANWQAENDKRAAKREEAAMRKLHEYHLSMLSPAAILRYGD